MTRRLLTAMLLSAAAVVVLAGLFARSPVGGRELCRVAEAALRDASAEPVRIGLCRVRPLSATVVLDDVRIGPASQPLFTARRLAARVDRRFLFGGRLRVDGVEIDRPRVALDLSTPPRANGVPERSRSPCLPDLGRLEIGTVTLTGGTVDLRLPGRRRLQAEGIGARVAGEGDTLAVDLSVGRARLVDQTGEESTERARLRGDLDLANRTARIRSLDLATEEGSVFAQATFADVCALRGTASATVRVDLARLGDHLLANVRGLKGSALAQATVAFGRQGYRATATLQVRDAKVGPFLPGDFDATLHATSQELSVDRFVMPFPSGKVLLTGTVGLAPPFSVRAEGRLEGLRLGELLSKLGVPGLPVDLELRGATALRGDFAGPGGLRLEGDLAARIPYFGVYDRPWRRRLESRQQYVGFREGKIAARFAILRDRLEIQGARITTPGSAGDVRGDIDFSARRGLDLAYDFSRLSLADFSPFASAALRGTGTLAGRLHGPFDALDIQADAAIAHLRVMKTQLGFAQASADLDLGRGILTVPRASGLIGHSRWSGRASMDLFHHARLDGSVQVQDARLSDLAGVARGYAPVLGELAGRTDALVSGTLSTSGPAAELNAAAHLKVKNALLFGERFPAGSVDATMTGADEWKVEALHLTRGAASLDFTGGFQLAGDRYSFETIARRLTAREIDPLIRRFPTLSGRVFLKADGSGTLSDPKANAILALRDFFLGAQPLATLRLSLALSGRVARVDGEVTSPWPAAQAPEWRKGKALPLPPSSMVHDFAGEVELESGLPFTVSAAFQVPELSKVLPPSRLGGVDGGLSGRFAARGRMTSLLASTSADLVLDRLWLKAGALRLDNSGPAELRLDGGRLTLEALPLAGTSVSLSAFGTLGVDGVLDLGAQGNADLSELTKLVPDLDAASGQALFSLTVNGTVENPLVVGNASVSGLELRPGDLPFVLTAGRGNVVFSPTELVADGIAAKLNGTPVELDGHLDLDRFRPRGFELNVQMGEVPLVLDDVPMTIAGDPTLRGTFQHMTLTGDLTLSRLRFTKDLDLERTIAEAIAVLLERRPPPVPQVFERGRDFLALDLGLHLSDVRVDDNLANAALRGDLKLTGTNKQPGLLGAVSFNDAKARLRDVEYDISSGVVNFTDRHRIRPVFDVRADTQVRDYRIHVTASGTVRRPHVVFASEPYLSRADIVTLLTLGVTSRDIDRTGAGSMAGFLVDAAYNASGLSDQVKKLLPKTTLIKDASLRLTSAYSELSGNIEPVAEFDGKLHWDNLKLQGETSLIGRERKAKAQWQFTKNLSGSVQVDSDNPDVPTADYGADLTWRMESP